MAAESFQFKLCQLQSVYHSPAEIGNLHAFVNRLMQTLDMWDEAHGFVVINEEVHGVPVGSVLLWPHFRFHGNALLHENAEVRLEASMLSHVGKMVSEQTSFQMNYAAPLWKKNKAMHKRNNVDGKQLYH